MKHLLKHAMNDAKVEDVLHEVAAGIRRLKYFYKITKIVCAL